jgi:hypothetical protein
MTDACKLAAREDADERYVSKPCPRDNDGDGNCGQRYCLNCSKRCSFCCEFTCPSLRYSALLHRHPFCPKLSDSSLTKA